MGIVLGVVVGAVWGALHIAVEGAVGPLREDCGPSVAVKMLFWVLFWVWLKVQLEPGGTLSWALQLFVLRHGDLQRFGRATGSVVSYDQLSTVSDHNFHVYPVVLVSDVLYIFVPISGLCNVFQTVQTFVVQCNLYQRIIPCGYNIEGEGAWRHVSKCP